MKKLFLLIAIISVSALGFAGNNSYYLEDAEVDALFENAVEVNVIDLASDFNAANAFEMASFNADKDALVAWIICWVGGSFGIHRLYLGTTTGTFLTYLFTCGGCGIVTTVDWFVLLIDGVINENVDKYIDNPKFIMWGN